MKYFFTLCIVDSKLPRLNQKKSHCLNTATASVWFIRFVCEHVLGIVFSGHVQPKSWKIHFLLLPSLGPIVQNRLIGTLSTHWNTNAVIRQICLCSPKPIWFDWSLFVKTGSVHLSYKQDISLSGLFVFCLLISGQLLGQGNTNTTRRKEGISFKCLFNTPLCFSTPRRGNKQEKGITSSSATSIASNSSLKWNTDARSKEMLHRAAAKKSSAISRDHP